MALKHPRQHRNASPYLNINPVFSQEPVKVPRDTLPAGENEMLKVHEALDVLAQAEPRLAKVVEMRYFGGYSEVEIGEVLELTERTVRRDWDKARLLLGAMLKD